MYFHELEFNLKFYCVAPSLTPYQIDLPDGETYALSA